MARRFVFSAIALILSLQLFEMPSLDLIVQQQFYDSVLNQWIVDRNNTYIKFVFYDGIKLLYLILIISITTSLVFFRSYSWVKQNRQGLLIVAISVILIPLLVSILKAVTNVPCPRDLQIFNGIYPYVSLTDSYPAGFVQPGKAQCFPAGHASGGFALMSLFFLFKDKKRRTTALLWAVCIGWTIGSYKTLIGDHFVSHTMFSMIFAWMICSLVAKLVTAASEYRHGFKPTVPLYLDHPGFKEASNDIPDKYFAYRVRNLNSVSTTGKYTAKAKHSLRLHD